jgi:hypothetical protein
VAVAVVVIAAFALAPALSISPLPAGQQFGALDAPTPAHARQYVVFAAEPVIVAAGRRTTIELHFQVLPEYHINSHTPKSELLIPTVVELPQAPGVKVFPAEYPVGTTFSFAFDPAEKLDVYQGDFVVRLPITAAAAGPHELKGTLHYQACNHAACYPPKDLQVNVVFTAK